MNTVSIQRTIFQNKRTKQYRWLSLESNSEGGGRFLCESKVDSPEPPSQKPSDGSSTPGSLVNYEEAVQRVAESGYDIVTRQ